MTHLRFSRPRFFVGPLVLACCAALGGCGQSTSSVTGSVKFNGEPLKGGMITFTPVDGKGPSFPTPIKEDGTYAVDKVLTGDYKVCVETESLRGQQGQGPRPMSPGGSGGSGNGGQMAGTDPSADLLAKAKSGKISNAPPPGSEPPADKAAMMQDGLTKMVENAKRYVAIPPMYAKPESTSLKFTATGGTQAADFDLQGP